MEDTMLELLEVCRQKEFYYMHNYVDELIESALNSKLLLINLKSQHLDKKKQEVKNIVEQPTKCGTRIEKSLHSFRVKKSSISLNNTSQISPVHLISPVLPTEEHEYSLSTETRTNFRVNNDDISSDDDAFEDIEYVEASFPNSELVSLEEENDVYQEDEDLTPNRVFKSSASFPIFEESNNYLSYSDNSSPDFETFSDHTKETKSDSTTTHANNSLPEYDSFCFEIESDQGRLTSVVKNDIYDNSTNDPLLEEVDLFLASDNSIPPGEVISAMMKNIDVLNEDECFDLRGEIDVFANIEDDDYFPFIFVIRIFLPYLIYPEVSPLLLSIGSEDTIFDPGIST
nr:hypothetical protein [Tanacetum cinerariifolium]